MNQVDGFQIVTDCNGGIPQLNNSMLSVPSNIVVVKALEQLRSLSVQLVSFICSVLFSWLMCFQISNL